MYKLSINILMYNLMYLYNMLINKYINDIFY
jgi:hypothetical protein